MGHSYMQYNVQMKNLYL